jgi:uncharacterized membrane protein YkvA (DUF1232 family)
VNRAVRLAATARDTSKPKVIRLVCLLAVAYIVLPLDFLPDLMPVIGWIDDVLVAVGVLTWLFNQRKQAAQQQPPILKR